MGLSELSHCDIVSCPGSWICGKHPTERRALRVWGQVVAAWLAVGDADREHLVKAVFTADVLTDSSWGLFETYILKFKSPVAAERGHRFTNGDGKKHK